MGTNLPHQSMDVANLRPLSVQGMLCVHLQQTQKPIHLLVVFGVGGVDVSQLVRSLHCRTIM